ncbi:hypothetical protein KKH23_04800 [Patescibacteria group bacterium]|nr:hypothetical protein [Patescibacteria group bacterium]
MNASDLSQTLDKLAPIGKEAVEQVQRLGLVSIIAGILALALGIVCGVAAWRIGGGSKTYWDVPSGRTILCIVAGCLCLIFLIVGSAWVCNGVERHIAPLQYLLGK